MSAFLLVCIFSLPFLFSILSIYLHLIFSISPKFTEPETPCVCCGVDKVLIIHLPTCRLAERKSKVFSPKLQHLPREWTWSTKEELQMRKKWRGNRRLLSIIMLLFRIYSLWSFFLFLFFYWCFIISYVCSSSHCLVFDCTLHSACRNLSVISPLSITLFLSLCLLNKLFCYYLFLGLF